ncbi:MAG: hypothetical protein HY301_01075 [Verrucomicrobia bacterium]|nr:hypothetical protein [Verrucomicrobiota bacterium]
MKKLLRLISLPLLLTAFTASAWDYAGHRTVNQLALQSLPADFPAFAKTPAARERIAFLAGEPDRWRNTQDHTLGHVNEPDHFFDLDYLAGFGLTAETISPFRYEFIGQLAAARAKKPDIEPIRDPAKDANFVRQFFGFLPWAINEHYSKLKSEFSYLKTFEAHGGTADEIRSAQENILYTMGVMGHYVGDLTQPLHTTKHFNGWLGDNPKDYTTWPRFHSWIDGGYLDKVGMKAEELYPKVRRAKPVADANSGNLGIFKPVMNVLVAQNRMVEPLYILNQRHKLSAEEDTAREGKAFLTEQLLKGGQFLGDIWLTAWQTAPEDKFLQSSLAKRKLKAGK